MEFRVERDLPIPLGTQLRGLIEYGIGCGQLTPGEQLPSVREMADLTGVAPMTVAKAYQHLKDCGLIEGRPGSGTFVVDLGMPPASAPKSLVDVHRDIDQLIDQCIALRLRPSDLAGLISARMAERLAAGPKKRVVMLGNFEAATAAYAATIDEVLDSAATVEPLLIDRVRSDPAARKRAATADLVLTFAHRRHEVVELLPDATVAAISFIPSESTRRSLASLDPLARVLVVSIFPEFTPLMKVSVQRFAPHVADITIIMPSAPDFDALLSTAGVLVYATGADDTLAQLPEGTPHFEFRHTPDPRDIKRVVLPIIASTKLIDEAVNLANLLDRAAAQGKAKRD